MNVGHTRRGFIWCTAQYERANINILKTDIYVGIQESNKKLLSGQYLEFNQSINVISY